MIELVSKAKCVQCNLCVSVCPTNVFDKVENDIPVIARKHDCQSCFMCELYCPADALYVAPEADQGVPIDEEQLEKHSLIGGYRKKVGWGPGRTPIASHDYIYQLNIRENF